MNDCVYKVYTAWLCTSIQFRQIRPQKRSHLVSVKVYPVTFWGFSPPILYRNLSFNFTKTTSYSGHWLRENSTKSIDSKRRNQSFDFVIWARGCRKELPPMSHSNPPVGSVEHRSWPFCKYTPFQEKMCAKNVCSFSASRTNKLFYDLISFSQKGLELHQT